MRIKVRNYQEKDKEVVNEILRESFQVEKENFKEESFYELVAEIEDKVCGYLLLTKVKNPILNKNYYLMDYVCVKEEFRGRKVGEELIKKAEEIAREEQAIYIQLTCNYNRKIAHHLYEKCGFIKRESDVFRKELIWF